MRADIRVKFHRSRNCFSVFRAKFGAVSSGLGVVKSFLFFSSVLLLFPKAIFWLSCRFENVPQSCPDTGALSSSLSLSLLDFVDKTWKDWFNLVGPQKFQSSHTFLFLVNASGQPLPRSAGWNLQPIVYKKSHGFLVLVCFCLASVCRRSVGQLEANCQSVHLQTKPIVSLSISPGFAFNFVPEGNPWQSRDTRPASPGI